MTVELRTESKLSPVGPAQVFFKSTTFPKYFHEKKAVNKILTHSSFLIVATQGLVEYNIATNIPPKGGSCDVSPKTGEELDTVFTFSCSGWRDEHQPLTFEMFYSHPNISEEDPVSHVSGELFFFGPSLENHGTILPMGKKENNYFVNVAVIIRDAYGEDVDKTLRIQVKPAFL